MAHFKNRIFFTIQISFWALDTMFMAHHVLKGAHMKAKE